MKSLDVNNFDSRFLGVITKKWLTPLLSIFLLFQVQTARAQGIRVGPEGEFSQQTLSLPFAFYNENFGFAAGYVYGKVGSPQIRLGNWLRQGVIALDYWTSYSPTWDEKSDGRIANRPPAYTGSTLGGLWRLRGFPSQRFNDKAAIYYAAELRLIPDWNPFHNWPRVQEYVGVQWLQFVPVVEVGRVAPNWSFSELNSNMKWNAGLGIRVWAQGIVARIDTAYSTEGVSVQMMISQPFQF
jgi:hypothetical protein